MIMCHVANDLGSRRLDVLLQRVAELAELYFSHVKSTSIWQSVCNIQDT